MKLCSGLALAWVLVLSLTASAHAQRGRVAVPHGGGAAPHGGQAHPGQAQHPSMISPEQHMRNMWMQQQQMMAYEMMARQRAHHLAAQPARAKAAQTAGSQSASGTPARRSGSGLKSTSPDARQNPQQPTAAGTKPNQSSLRDAQTSKKDSSAARVKEKRQDKPREVPKQRRREESALGRTPLAADQTTIGHLRMAHGKLRKADADYAGHRVRAMEHITSALRHLGSEASLGGGFTVSSGDMAQSQSDQILRDAITQLSFAEKNLGTKTTGADHHRSAHMSVAEAIRELHTALRIR